MLLALHFASVLEVSGSFQLLYLIQCCCPQLSFLSFLCLALTLETVMSFRCLCFFFFNFVFVFSFSMSGPVLQLMVSVLPLAVFTCTVVACAVARSLSPVLARVVAFSLYYSFAPVHVDCRVALIHWLVLTTLLHVILIKDFNELVRCHNLAILFNVVTGLRSEELHLFVFLVILVFVLSEPATSSFRFENNDTKKNTIKRYIHFQEHDFTIGFYPVKKHRLLALSFTVVSAVTSN